MENPCSYKSVKCVLKNIIETASQTRQWSIAGCDGSPYILESRLMNKSFICSFCSDDFSNKSSFETHLTENHGVCDIKSELNKCREYGKVLLIPGLGHIEINMIKGLFKLLWPIYFKDLAAMLGFRTVRAQTCCQNATDHHKAMQVLEIALFALADELIYEYCNICKQNNFQPSVEGYNFFLKNAVKNENFLFASEVVFTYMLSVYMFRAAVRRNNPD